MAAAKATEIEVPGGPDGGRTVRISSPDRLIWPDDDATPGGITKLALAQYAVDVSDGLMRALAHRPAILLLDEATSSLDLDTESQVHRNLAALGCTRIVIAHRLDTVRDADLILVLDDGKIIQQGNWTASKDGRGSSFRRKGFPFPQRPPRPRLGVPLCRVHGGTPR